MADVFDTGQPAKVTPNVSPLAKDSSRIFDQIESAADFYSPAVYNKLLTFSANYESQDDAASNDFIPLTATRSNTKPFVVGILPPSINVTGRLLDRSASIASTQGGGSILDSTSSGTGNGSIRDVALAAAREVVPSQYPDPAFLKMTNGSFNPGDGKSSSCGFLTSHVLYSIGVRDGRILNRNDPDSGLKYTPGANIARLVQGAKTLGAWRTQEKDGAPKPGDLVYVAEVNDTGGISKEHVMVFSDINDKGQWHSFDGGHPAATSTGEAVRDTTGDGSLAFFGGSRKVVGYVSIDALPIEVPPAGAAKGTAADWQSSGSANASAAANEQAKTANTSISKEDLGKAYMQKQQAEINATKQLLDQMANTPPLRLLVNPRSFKIDAEKVISDGNFTRRGPLVEHWGDGQDKLEGSGKVAGFYAIDATNPVGPGLNRSARSYSKSYQNLLSLWLLYRNNGGLHVWDTTGTDQFGNYQARLSMLGSIYIFYDGVMYVGSFDSFNLTETETASFSLEYSFTFTVRAWFLLDRAPDPKLTYGYSPKSVSNDITSTTQNDSAIAEDPATRAANLTQAMQEAVDKSNSPEATEALHNELARLGF